MISKEKIKFIHSLHDKKWRQEEWLFLVEWRKSLEELLHSNLEIKELFITPEFYRKNSHLLEKVINTVCAQTDIEKASTLKTNDGWIALVYIPNEVKFADKKNDIVLVLDNINDPGNLWTIMRTADWYWITHIVASENTVEAYNPKVIIASMWSFSRTIVHYTNLENFLKDKNNMYGAFLEWKNIHTLEKKDISTPIYLVIGNESHGISPIIEKYIQNKITIPRFGESESLNAGIATGIILDNLKRILKK